VAPGGDGHRPAVPHRFLAGGAQERPGRAAAGGQEGGGEAGGLAGGAVCGDLSQGRQQCGPGFPDADAGHLPGAADGAAGSQRGVGRGEEQRPTAGTAQASGAGEGGEEEEMLVLELGTPAARPGRAGTRWALPAAVGGEAGSQQRATARAN